MEREKIKAAVKYIAYLMFDKTTFHFEEDVMKVIDETENWDLITELKALEHRKYLNGTSKESETLESTY